MSTFILIHGAWHGAWCWDEVIPFLTAKGHTVFAPDMPAMGGDQTPVAEATFARAMASIVALIDAAAGPVIVVGHSMGGIAVTQAAEERPDKIAKVVYVTAFIPKNGESCLSLAMSDSGTVPYGLEIAADGSVATVRDEWIKASFFGDCSDDMVASAKSKLKPQPVEPYAHPAAVSDGKAGTVPRIYIECLRDHAITPGFQKKMYTDNPCELVLSLDTSHSPFFSAPEALATQLLSVAG